MFEKEEALEILTNVRENMFELEKELLNINNYQVTKYFMVTKQKIEQYQNIMVAISGGKDSDIMLDMFSKLDTEKKVKYVWFDTGLEYKATKDHLEYLEAKYDVKIYREKAIKSIPLSVKEYGHPFLSKRISQFIEGLQRYNFDFSGDGRKDYSELIIKYPKIKSYLQWWCDCAGTTKEGKLHSAFNISGRKELKEFMIQNPPDFKISSKCCKYAKKDVAKKFCKLNNVGLNVIGVRKAEGGIRTTSIKNCFTHHDDYVDEYRPLFFFKDNDIKYYKDFFNIKNSDCYDIWGMERTGCVGCPLDMKLFETLELCKNYEPNMYKACINIFGKSYEYTDKYKKYRDEMKQRESERLIKQH